MKLLINVFSFMTHVGTESPRAAPTHNRHERVIKRCKRKRRTPCNVPGGYKYPWKRVADSHRACLVRCHTHSQKEGQVLLSVEDIKKREIREREREIVYIVVVRAGSPVHCTQ